MAAIDTLDGISRKNGHEYRVTKQVVVATNIDDVVESAFIIEDGGRLMFGDGCTTTFTRCDFIELKSMQVYQTSSMASKNHQSRFQEGCKPVFRGCSFKLENEMASNSIGVTPTAAPEFRADEFGRSTYFFIDNRYQSGKNHWFWNAWRSPDMVIDGVVWDMKGPKDLTFVVPPPIKNLILIDNEPGAGGRVLTFLCQYWASGTTYEITGIGSRNVCLWGSDASKTLIVSDPVGTVRRSVDGAGRGEIVVKRTYKALPFDPLANAAVAVKTYLKNTDNDEIIVDGYTDGVDEKLHSYTIPHEKKNEADHVFENNYIRGFYRFGFESQIKMMAVIPDNEGEQYDDGSVLMLPDTSITETNKAVVDAYPISMTVTDTIVTVQSTGDSITTRQAYDAICANVEDNWQAVDLRIARAGENLDFGGRLVFLANVTITGGQLITTDIVTLEDGAASLGGIIDANGDSFLSFEAVDNWTIFSSEADRRTGKNALGTGPGIFRFNFAENTTYYLRLEVSDEFILKNITPPAAGKTSVSLSTAGLLGGIAANVKALGASISITQDMVTIAAQNIQN